MQDGTALENVTDFIRVSNLMCREGELAGVTFILVYSGFSIRQRRTQMYFLKFPFIIPLAYLEIHC